MSRPSAIFPGHRGSTASPHCSADSIRWVLLIRTGVQYRYVPGQPLCDNMTETSCVTAISEQGGKENQHGNDERFCSARCGCDGSY